MRFDNSSSVSSGSKLPLEIHLLCMLHNIGATKTESSLTIQQISEWTKLATTELSFPLQKLVELGYIQLFQTEGTDKYHLTLDGIRKVLSMYS